MKKSNWFVGQNGKQVDIYMRVIPDDEDPRTLTVAQDLNPEVAKVLVELHNDFENRLAEIEAGLMRMVIEAKKLL